MFVLFTAFGVAVGVLLAALAATLPVDLTTRCTVTPSLIPTNTKQFNYILPSQFILTTPHRKILEFLHPLKFFQQILNTECQFPRLISLIEIP